MDQPASGPDQTGQARDVALVALRRWLANQALLATPVPAVANGFAEGLLKAGDSSLARSCRGLDAGSSDGGNGAHLDPGG